MKAIVYHEYGSPDVLRSEEVDRPTPKDKEVLVRVRAVSVNDWDWELLHGTPFANRVMSGLVKPKKKILGYRRSRAGGSGRQGRVPVSAG